MCWESGFSFNSIRIENILKRNNLKAISVDGIASIPIKSLGKKIISKF